MLTEKPFIDANNFSFKETYFTLLDNLVSNKSTSRLESILLMIVFYFQLVSGFFDEKVGIFLNSQIPDNYFITANKILRLQKFFTSSFANYSFMIYLLVAFDILIIILFISRIYMLSKDKQGIYSFFDVLLNFCIKIYFYILFQPSLDMVFGFFCFDEQHIVIKNTTCSMKDKITGLIFVLILLILTIGLGMIISVYYNDNMLLSNGFFARLSVKYEIYLVIHLILFSLLLNYINYIGSIIFIIYNVFSSFFLLKYFLSINPFYDQITNYIIGYFHWIYLWTSLFCFIFSLLPLEQVSILYTLIALVFAYMHCNLSLSKNEKISLATSFTKLHTTHSALIYIKLLNSMINSIETSSEEKAKVIGIIQMHDKEFPDHSCPLKEEHKFLFFPQTGEWFSPLGGKANRSIDRIYLSFFLSFIFQFYIDQKIISPDLLMNFSIHYLNIIGNTYLSMYYCQKAKRDSILNREEEFMHFRTRRLITQTINKPLKPSDEIASTLEEVDMTMFFKYQHISEQFLSKIMNDAMLCLSFWNMLIDSKGNRKRLDFNKIYTLAEKVKKTKEEVDQLWRELFGTYTACNEIFDLFEQYTEFMCDDEAQMHNLNDIRDKNHQIKGILNYYNFLFDNETGIIIANGDKNKEGLIEKASSNISLFFNYTKEEIKGMNVSSLMPKLFEREHNTYIKRCVDVGEKKVIDKMILAFGKDKQNYLFPINITIKLFPLLCDNIFFGAMFHKESFDDVIILDKNFIIQGMSKKLMNVFLLEPMLFQTCEVPFWFICKDFLQHYQTFMMNNSVFNNNKNNDEKLKRTQTKVADYEYEINENTELEWQIVIPPVLLTFTIVYNEQLLDVSNQVDDSNMNVLDSYRAGEDEEENNESLENSVNEALNEDEEANLIGTNEESVNSKAITQIGEINQQIESSIDRYTKLFNSKDPGNIQGLLGIIEKINEESEHLFPYIISFKQIAFGEGNYGFVIRCLDKEQDNSKNSISENNLEQIFKKDHEDNKSVILNMKKHNSIICKKMNFNRKNNLIDMTKLVQKVNDDLLYYINNYEINIFNQPKTKEAIVAFREEILSVSKIFGNSSINNIDENQSLASSVSYLSNAISKHTHIQQIKNELIKEGEKHVLILGIRILFLIIGVISVCFVFVNVITINIYFHEASELNTFHGNITEFILYYVGLLSITSSLRAVNMVFNKEQDKYEYNFYTGASKDVYVVTNYNLIIHLIQEMNFKEQRMEAIQLDSIKTSFPILWMNVVLNLTTIDYQSDSALITNLCIILYQALELISTPSFNLSNSIDETYMPKIDYLFKRIINYSYLTNLATMLTVSNDTKTICINENKYDIQISQHLLRGYFSIIIALLLVYSLLLFILNKTIEKSVILISKINPKLIQEIIKGITFFKNNYANNLSSQSPLNPNIINENNFKETIAILKEKETQKKEEEDTNGVLFDEHEHQRLTLLNYAYYQIIIVLFICISFFVPFDIILTNIVIDANSLFSVREYMYSDLFRVGFNLLNVKRKIVEGDKVITYPYTRNFSIEDKQKIITHINKFKELHEFYHIAYNNGLCKQLQEDPYNLHKNCVNDPIVKSNENLYQVIEILELLIYNMNKDIEIGHLITSESKVSFLHHLNQLSTSNFKKSEHIYNNYLIFFPRIIEKTFQQVLITFFNECKRTLIALNVIFTVLMLLFSIYVIGFLVSKLIKMLVLSRFLIKLVPTQVIDQTKDLEKWIENKFL